MSSGTPSCQTWSYCYWTLERRGHASKKDNEKVASLYYAGVQSMDDFIQDCLTGGGAKSPSSSPIELIINHRHCNAIVRVLLRGIKAATFAVRYSCNNAVFSGTDLELRFQDNEVLICAAPLESGSSPS